MVDVWQLTSLIASAIIMFFFPGFLLVRELLTYKPHKTYSVLEIFGLSFVIGLIMGGVIGHLLILTGNFTIFNVLLTEFFIIGLVIAYNRRYYRLFSFWCFILLTSLSWYIVYLIVQAVFPMPLDIAKAFPEPNPNLEQGFGFGKWVKISIVIACLAFIAYVWIKELLSLAKKTGKILTDGFRWELAAVLLIIVAYGLLYGKPYEWFKHGGWDAGNYQTISSLILHQGSLSDQRIPHIMYPELQKNDWVHPFTWYWNTKEYNKYGSNGIISPRFLHVHPVLWAMVKYFVNDYYALAINGIYAAINYLIFFLLLSILFKRKGLAFLATLFLMIAGLQFHYSKSIMSEMSYESFMLYSFFLLAIAMRDRDYRWAFFGGVSFTLIMFAKIDANFLILPMYFGISLILYFSNVSEKTKRVIWFYSISFAFSFFFVWRYYHNHAWAYLDQVFSVIKELRTLPAPLSNLAIMYPIHLFEVLMYVLVMPALLYPVIKWLLYDTFPIMRYIKLLVNWKYFMFAVKTGIFIMIIAVFYWLDTVYPTLNVDPPHKKETLNRLMTTYAPTLIYIGMFGIGWAIFRMRTAAIPFISVCLITFIIFLINSRHNSNIPIWVLRRIMPVAMPLLSFGVAFAISELYNVFRRGKHLASFTVVGIALGLITFFATKFSFQTASVWEWWKKLPFSHEVLGFIFPNFPQQSLSYISFGIITLVIFFFFLLVGAIGRYALRLLRGAELVKGGKSFIITTFSIIALFITGYYLAEGVDSSTKTQGENFFLLKILNIKWDDFFLLLCFIVSLLLLTYNMVRVFILKSSAWVSLAPIILIIMSLFVIEKSYPYLRIFTEYGEMEGCYQEVKKIASHFGENDVVLFVHGEKSYSEFYPIINYVFYKNSIALNPQTMNMVNLMNLVRNQIKKKNRVFIFEPTDAIMMTVENEFRFCEIYPMTRSTYPFYWGNVSPVDASPIKTASYSLNYNLFEISNNECPKLMGQGEPIPQWNYGNCDNSFQDIGGRSGGIYIVDKRFSADNQNWQDFSNKVVPGAPLSLVFKTTPGVYKLKIATITSNPDTGFVNLDDQKIGEFIVPGVRTGEDSAKSTITVKINDSEQHTLTIGVMEGTDGFGFDCIEFSKNN